VLASLILLGGFIGAGHAIKGPLSYTRIEAEGLRQLRFLNPGKYQRWDELISVKLQEMETLKKGRGITHLSRLVSLEFKDGGAGVSSSHSQAMSFPGRISYALKNR